MDGLDCSPLATLSSEFGNVTGLDGLQLLISGLLSGVVLPNINKFLGSGACVRACVRSLVRACVRACGRAGRSRVSLTRARARARVCVSTPWNLLVNNTQQRGTARHGTARGAPTGIALPSIDGVSLTKSAITPVDGALAISSDISWDPTVYGLYK